ncbi:MAG: toll/interleukin-1 receptor domain-containing protein [Nitrosomonas sp.]|uniref:toll/interleukin-1 receptor domain-containing protein n=1 Tax=Nitrosomonas sp. TaxID=42353 RepID=UPI0032EE0106
MTDNPPDAFLSHHSADKPAVERIAAALQKQGLSCFLDKWEIAPGDEWLRNLEQGLRNSRFIVIFFGPDGIGPYQQAEADAALRCGGKSSNVSIASFRCCCRARRPSTSRSVRCFCRASTR